MADLPGFEPVLRKFPSWYTPSKNRSHLEGSRVLRGLHPTGDPLGPESETCGSCAHRVTRGYGSKYHKCSLRPITGGPATDIRIKWRACARWSATAPTAATEPHTRG